jgi:Alpha-lytic protease prodomain/Trypsin
MKFPRPMVQTQCSSIAPALAFVAALLVQAPAHAQSSAPTNNPPPQVMGRQLADILRRDLGLNTRSLRQYVETEQRAIAATPGIEARLGTAYAGSWIERGADGKHRLIVASTKPYSAKSADAIVAEVRTARFSLAQLQSTKDSLDRIASKRTTPSPLYSWYVDVKSNRLVVTIDRTRKEQAIEMIAASDIDIAQISVVESQFRPRTTQFVQQIVMGGDSYLLMNTGHCSIGFSGVRNGQRGFVTAGHCGNIGTATYRVYPGPYSGQLFWLGGLQLSVYPGNDFAWSTVSNPQMFTFPNVRNAFLSFNNLIPVRGDLQAPVGASVCRSGFKTGLRCGVIQAQNVSVDYGVGIVYGLTQTTACAGFGDSGGSVITPGGQAQGVVSGGELVQGTDNNCSQPTPVTFYQPIQPMMAQNGITLQLSN